MPKRIDLTGQTINGLKVIRRADKKDGKNAYWEFTCPLCGETGTTSTYNIKNGKVQSCGCLVRKNGSKFFKKYNTTHGESRTRLYTCWHNMIDRTTNTKNKAYKQYGARGITVCEEWKDYLKFKEWAIKNGYSEELTLERIDNNRGYGPDNCKWADWDTQNNNKQQSRKISYNGEIKTIDQWAKQFNINRSTLTHRLNKGWTLKKAIETPIKNGSGKGYVPHKKQKHCTELHE